ncbi:MAG: tetratricopeptide repeat protein, partial [Bacteroidota bacterium]
QKYLYRQQIDSALIALEQVVEKRPEWAAPYSLRSEAYSRKGEMEASLNNITRAIQLTEDSPRKRARLISNRAYYKEKAKDYEGALRDYEVALRYDPNYADAYFRRGNLFFFQKEFQMAIQEYDKALQIRRYFPDALYNRAYLKYILGDFRGAMDDVNVVLKINYRFHPALNFRALLQMELKYYQGAIRDLNRAIEENPTLGIYYFNRARCYKLIGKQRKACRDWRRAKRRGFQTVNLNFTVDCK